MTTLDLPDAAASADLRTFAGRARRLDEGAVLRLVAAGPVLAVYASALHGPGTPTVLALRVMTLASPLRADETVPAAGLVDRLARIERSAAAQPIQVELPPSSSGSSAGWAGVLPPRAGWSVEGVLRIDDLRSAARAGIEEVAAGTPALAGSAAVTRLRAGVWGRPLFPDGSHPELPAGAAFGAEAFGFLGPTGAGIDEEPVSLHRNGRWWRLSTTRGHVLARPPLGL